jgi:hypothetical protein
MVGVPVAIPVTAPVVEFTVASVPSLELHVPPDTASVRFMLEVVHTLEGPPIEAGVWFTVKTAVVRHKPKV